MGIKYSNNAITTLAVDISAEDTSIPVGIAAMFPELGVNDYCYLTIGDGRINIEIVKVTSIAGNTLTVVRGQQGTIPKDFPAGTIIELRLTAGMLEEAINEKGDVTTDQTISQTIGDTNNRLEKVFTEDIDNSGTANLGTISGNSLTIGDLTGIAKLSTGVLSIASVNDFPILNQNTTGSSGSCTGNAATATDLVSGSTLSVNKGGTGAGTLTGIVKGNGTSAFSAATAGTDYVNKDTVTLFEAQQSGKQVALTSTSNSIATNCNLSNNFSHTFTEDTTLANPTNIVAGTYYAWTFTQHASSAKTLALGNYFKSADGEAFAGMPTTDGAICTLFAYAETTTSLVYNWVTKGL